MKMIPLIATPNQSLSFDHGETRFDLRIFSAGSCMYADIDIDGERVLSATRLVADAPMIPYKHLSTKGNFALLCDTGCKPYWRGFGTVQQLYFASPEELQA